MKITKSQLQRIIKEELQQIMSEQQTADQAQAIRQRGEELAAMAANPDIRQGTVPMPFPLTIPGIVATTVGGSALGLGAMAAAEEAKQALLGREAAAQEREQDREYREGPAPDVAVGGVGMMSPKERAEVARLRGTGPRPPSGPSPEQISVARSMMDPQRQRGTLSPGEVARLSTGAFTEPELQQMQVRESLINDLTEAVLAKLTKR